MLKTVNENEEERQEMTSSQQQQQQVLKAEPVLLEDGSGSDVENSNNIIVQTKRTIFTPVHSSSSGPPEAESGSAGGKTCTTAGNSTIPVLVGAQLKSPALVRKLTQDHIEEEGAPSVRKIEPPRVVGAIRKSSNASSILLNPIPPKDPAHHRPSLPKLNTTAAAAGKIPVWCSPLLARRKLSNQKSIEEKFVPTPTTLNDNFSLDKFLQDTNLIPIPPPRPSRIPTVTSPGVSRRKYQVTAGSLASGEEEKVRLVSLARSSSFQGNNYKPNTNTESSKPIKVPQPTTTREPVTSSVVKSKSTGSMLGGGKGLFGLATKFGLKSSSPEQKSSHCSKMIFPAWLRNSSSSNSSSSSTNNNTGNTQASKK